MITLESYQSTGTSPIHCHRDYLVCCDNIGHVPVDWQDSRVITMATSLHPSLSCLPPFYPIFSSFRSTLGHCILFYTLRNISIIACFDTVLFTLYAMLLEFCYVHVCTPTSLLQLLTWATFLFNLRIDFINLRIDCLRYLSA